MIDVRSWWDLHETSSFGTIQSRFNGGIFKRWYLQYAQNIMTPKYKANTAISTSVAAWKS